MKLQILELDPHDDHVSARDKLARVKADRVLLVWPRRGRILHRRLDLVLLHRKAANRNLQLGLLSHDPEVRDRAAELGIPLFDSLDHLPERRWQSYRPPSIPERRTEGEGPDARPAERALPARLTPARGTPFWLRILLVGLAAGSLLALAAVLLPSATLVVQPEVTPQASRLTLPLTATDDPPAADPQRLPVERVEVTVAVSRRMETTGLIAVPDGRATGTLRFTNLSPEPIEIPVGTSARPTGSEPPRFLTVEPALLAGGRGTQVDVPAEAAVPGGAGNISAGAVDTVDGPIGLAVSVTNPEPFRGGSESLAPAVTAGDQQALRRQSLDAAHQQGRDRLAEGTPAGSVLIPDSVELVKTVESEFDGAPGEIAASLGLDLRASVAGLRYAQQDMAQLALRAVEGQAAEAEWKYVPESLEIGQVTYRTRGEEQAPELAVAVSWMGYRPAPPALTAAVAGRPPSDLPALTSRYSVRLVRVERWPPWLPRLPWVMSRIQVRYPWEAN